MLYRIVNSYILGRYAIISLQFSTFPEIQEFTLTKKCLRSLIRLIIFFIG